MTGLEGIPYCSVHRATATIHINVCSGISQTVAYTVALKFCRSKFCGLWAICNIIDMSCEHAMSVMADGSTQG